MEKLLQYLDEKRGRRVELAKAIGVHPSAISMWTRVPGERLGEVSRATGLSPQDLRPDFFAPARKKK